jgi:hypothetical protein
MGNDIIIIMDKEILQMYDELKKASDRIKSGIRIDSNSKINPKALDILENLATKIKLSAEQRKHIKAMRDELTRREKLNAIAGKASGYKEGEAAQIKQAKAENEKKQLEEHLETNTPEKMATKAGPSASLTAKPGKPPKKSEKVGSVPKSDKKAAPSASLT